MNFHNRKISTSAIPNCQLSYFSTSWYGNKCPRYHLKKHWCLIKISKALWLLQSLVLKNDGKNANTALLGNDMTVFLLKKLRTRDSQRFS